MILNKRQIINNKVVQARLGSKENFTSLWNMYNFMLKQIYESFAKVYKFLQYSEFEVFQYFYIAMWEVIAEFNFDIDFSFFLKKRMIEKYLLELKKSYRLPDEAIASPEMIRGLITNNKDRKAKINFRRRLVVCFRNIPVKCLQIVMLKYYFNKSRKEIFNILGINDRRYYRRLKPLNKKIRKYMCGVRKQIRGGKGKTALSEKTYYMQHNHFSLEKMHDGTKKKFR